MVWHDIRNPHDPELDRLAAQYKLHPLHIEDCRHRNQAAKLEYQNGYLFMVMKPIEMTAECDLEIGDLDFFLGRDFIITVQETECQFLGSVLDKSRLPADRLRADQMLYRIMDALVDTYSPVLDQLAERLDAIEEKVVEAPEPQMLQRIFEMRRAMIELRRVLANSRDVVGSLQRQESGLVAPDLMPFLRDVYDHLARNLDRIEVQRDVLTGATEVYLSSVANQTNQVMKVLTVFGTLATPALVVTGIYGMNLQHLPFASHPHAAAIVISSIAVISLGLLLAFRRSGWI